MARRIARHGSDQKAAENHPGRECNIWPAPGVSRWLKGLSAGPEEEAKARSAFSAGGSWCFKSNCRDELIEEYLWRAMGKLGKPDWTVPRWQA
jgi:hypothetical protein